MGKKQSIKAYQVEEDGRRGVNVDSVARPEGLHHHGLIGLRKIQPVKRKSFLNAFSQYHLELLLGQSVDDADVLLCAVVRVEAGGGQEERLHVLAGDGVLVAGGLPLAPLAAGEEAAEEGAAHQRLAGYGQCRAAAAQGDGSNPGSHAQAEDGGGAAEGGGEAKAEKKEGLHFAVFFDGDFDAWSWCRIRYRSMPMSQSAGLYIPGLPRSVNSERRKVAPLRGTGPLRNSSLLKHPLNPCSL